MSFTVSPQDPLQGIDVGQAGVHVLSIALFRHLRNRATSSMRLSAGNHRGLVRLLTQNPKLGSGRPYTYTYHNTWYPIKTSVDYICIIMGASLWVRLYGCVCMGTSLEMRRWVCVGGCVSRCVGGPIMINTSFFLNALGLD